MPVVALDSAVDAVYGCDELEWDTQYLERGLVRDERGL